MKIIAVGFKVSQDRSVFYRKAEVNNYADYDDFMEKLLTLIQSKEPDFISIRCIYSGQLKSI